MPASIELWVYGAMTGELLTMPRVVLQSTSCELQLPIAASGHRRWDGLATPLLPCHKSPLSLTGNVANKGSGGTDSGGVMNFNESRHVWHSLYCGQDRISNWEHQKSCCGYICMVAGQIRDQTCHWIQDCFGKFILTRNLSGSGWPSFLKFAMFIPSMCV